MTSLPQLRLFRLLRANFPAWREGAIQALEAYQREFDSASAARRLHLLRSSPRESFRMYIEAIREDRARWKEWKDCGHKTLTDIEVVSAQLAYPWRNG